MRKIYLSREVPKHQDFIYKRKTYTLILHITDTVPENILSFSRLPASQWHIYVVNCCVGRTIPEMRYEIKYDREMNLCLSCIFICSNYFL